MKKMIFALVTMLTFSLSASAMSYEQARNEALFLTDKMAYELNLTDAQYEAAFEINLDYLMSVATVDDVFGVYWERRNLDLSYILYSWQWDAFRAATYFYRPLYWEAGHWHFGIYIRYPRRDYFYFGRPHFYATYRGSHSWHVNGGRSYYHGRDSHFRPNLPQGRQHVGMRNSYDRGDFRGVRGGSSTRVTSHQDRGRSSFGRSNNENRTLNNRNTIERGNGNNNRGTIERGNGNSNRYSSGSFGNNSTVERGNSNSNRSTIERGNSNSNRYSSGSFGNSAPSRSIGSSTPSRSIGSSNPSRSTGSSPAMRGGSRSSSSSPAVRGGSRSSGSSNSHGHFGGGRR